MGIDSDSSEEVPESESSEVPESSESEDSGAGQGPGSGDAPEKKEVSVQQTTISMPFTSTVALTATQLTDLGASTTAGLAEAFPDFTVTATVALAPAADERRRTETFNYIITIVMTPNKTGVAAPEVSAVATGLETVVADSDLEITLDVDSATSVSAAVMIEVPVDDAASS